MKRPDPPRVAGPYTIRPMRIADISQVSTIEQEAFSTPWPAYAYQHELTSNDFSHYYVLTRTSYSAPGARSWWDRWRGLWQANHASGPASEVLGYGGFWMTSWSEAHISTIAVASTWRGHRLGELLLLTMVERAAELGSHQVTLEVRVSNAVAQNLYRKYGFGVTGTHPGYYHDNNEDAYLMTIPALDAAYRAKLAHLHEQLYAKLQISQPESRRTIG